MQAKRQFKKKTEEELQKTRNVFRSVNTDRSTNTSLKIWNDYCIGLGLFTPNTFKPIDMYTLNKVDLNRHLESLVSQLKKKSGGDLRASSIATYVNGWQRYLKERYIKENFNKERKDGFVNLFYDGEFDSFRYQLKSKYTDLLQKGFAKIDHTKSITKKEYLEILKEHNFDGPTDLIKLLILTLGIHLGLRGGTHERLKIQQFVHKTDDGNWNYYEWVELTSKVRKPNVRGKVHNPRIIRIYENSENLKCCYYVLKRYLEKRPNDMKNDAFYAQPNCNFYKNKTKKWFNSCKLGKNTIYRYFKEVVSPLEEKKIRLHSLRATAITWLEHKGMDFKTIAKISGHRDPRSMEKYLNMGNERKREISEYLSEVEVTSNRKEKEVKMEKRKRKNDLGLEEIVNRKTNNLHFEFGKTTIKNFSIVNNYATRNRSPRKKIIKIPIRTPIVEENRRKNIQEFAFHKRDVELEIQELEIEKNVRILFSKGCYKIKNRTKYELLSFNEFKEYVDCVNCHLAELKKYTENEIGQLGDVILKRRIAEFEELKQSTHRHSSIEPKQQLEIRSIRHFPRTPNKKLDSSIHF
ncbi:hypothetical protein M0813_23331 [Anaeramoeba flamelloides]|uniref:Tyr recombinase domain-containing protein n=1 Tax=Anaeramoeba flamelloides TaxID=1746091 RepID=A0ABQ8Y939_9EUKA|nr:hypothetical protein M0813_23331 [Anaeramoeba flamelloides]